MVGIEIMGSACPMAAPKERIASASEKPAEIKRKGRRIETKDTANEFAERMAVMGMADLISGLNSEVGLVKRFFLINQN